MPDRWWSVPPDRLAELQRQRELVRAHLAWLDHEITLAMGRPAPNPPLSPTAKPMVQAVHVTDIAPPDPAVSAAEARRGCLTLAIGVLVLTVLAAVGIYFLLYRDRPLL